MRQIPIDLEMGSAAAAREEAFDESPRTVRIDLEGLFERFLRLAN